MFQNPLYILLLSVFLYGCGGGNSFEPDPTLPNTNTPDTDEGGGSNTPSQNTQLLDQPFDANAVYTTELYVQGTATVNGDGSQASPFNNIDSAIQAAGPGSRIHILAGSYAPPGSISGLQGTMNNPVAIVAEGQVIIDANNNGVGLSLHDVRFVVIEGLIIQNTGIHGINIDDGGSYATPSEYIVLRNIHLRNIGSGGNNDCLKMSGVDNFYIEGSEFESCNRGEAIDMVGCHDGVITGNHFHDVVINAVQTKGGSSDILIHGNRFVDIPVRAINAGGNTGSQYFRPIDAAYEAQNITIVSNLFVRTGNSVVVFSGCDTCIVANNTIIEPSGYVFWVVEENMTKGPGRNGQFLNNIVVFNDTDLGNFSFFNSNGLSLNNTFIIDANLWFAQDNSSFSSVPNGHGLPMGLNGIVQSDPSLDANYITQAGSPAIGQGISVPGGVPADYMGDAFANPPNIGAFATP